jgi:hypothetical protein
MMLVMIIGIMVILQVEITGVIIQDRIISRVQTKIFSEVMELEIIIAQYQEDQISIIILLLIR